MKSYTVIYFYKTTNWIKGVLIIWEVNIIVGRELKYKKSLLVIVCSAFRDSNIYDQFAGAIFV